MHKSINDYLAEPYVRIVIPDDTGYFAEILEFPGCIASGDTPGEAYSNLEDVAKEWIQAELEKGHEIPPPSDSESYSGKFPLRMPRGMHRQAAKLADLDGVSLNQYIVSAIAMKTGADDLLRRVTERLRSITLNASIYISGSVETQKETPCIDQTKSIAFGAEART